METFQGPSEKRPRAATKGNRLPADIDININGNPPPTGANVNGNPPPTNNNGSRPLADTNGDPPPTDTSGNQPDPRLQTWLQGGDHPYPAEYFEPGDRTWEDIKADTVAKRPEIDEMDNPRLATKKSATSLRRQVQEANTDAPTEKTEDKAQPYRSPGYVQELKDQKSHLYDAPEGITDEDKELCRKLLAIVQEVPQDSDFRDDRFEETCKKVQDRNEARVVEDISPLIAPSPEKLATHGAKELEHLVFNANERWSESRPMTKTRPQPDGSVGFNRSAYTESQVQKMLPYIGNRVPNNFYSLFLATWQTFFPFFAREAKCGIGDLDVADRQNAHSMTMAVRGIFELFKIVHREDELHRRILAFSISHDARIVRIYGHYTTIEKRVASFWRHPIREFSFAEQDGKEKWTAYQFTKNVYFGFMPKLHRRICSAIDQIPLDAAPSLLRSILSQQLPPDASFGSTDLESEQPGSQELALSAPGSQEPVGSKKRRLTGNAVLMQRNEELARQLAERDENALGGVVKTLQEELKWQRQESERQRQELKEQLEKQQEQISKLTETLMQSLSASPKQKAKK